MYKSLTKLEHRSKHNILKHPNTNSARIKKKKGEKKRKNIWVIFQEHTNSNNKVNISYVDN